MRDGWTMYDDEFRRVSASARTPQSRDAYVFYPDGARAEVMRPCNGQRDPRRLVVPPVEMVLPPATYDGVAQEQLGQIRVAAMSLTRQSDCWRERHLAMVPCTQHARCTIYRQPGQQPPLSVLSQLGMAWAKEAWKPLHMLLDHPRPDQIADAAPPPQPQLPSIMYLREAIPAHRYDVANLRPRFSIWENRDGRPADPFPSDYQTFPSAEAATAAFAAMAIAAGRPDLQHLAPGHVVIHSGYRVPMIITAVGERVEDASSAAAIFNNRVQWERGAGSMTAFARCSFAQALDVIHLAEAPTTIAPLSAWVDCQTGWRKQWTGLALAPLAATSEPATSELATSEPATSEPTTSEPVTSEPATSVPATSVPTACVPVASVPAASVPLSESENEDAEAEWDREAGGQLQRGDARRRRVVQHEDDRGNRWEEMIEGLPLDSDEEDEMSCGLFTAW